MKTLEELGYKSQDVSHGVWEDKKMLYHFTVGPNWEKEIVITEDQKVLASYKYDGHGKRYPLWLSKEEIKAISNLLE